MNFHERDRLPTADAASQQAEPPLVRFTVRTLLERTGQVVRGAFPHPAWVEGTVLKIRRGKTGYQVELVETHAADPSRCARLDCFLSDRALTSIRDELAFDLDPTTLEGTCVILKMTISFQPGYNKVEGRVLGLNPAWTEDHFKKAVEAIRQALKSENLFHAQARLPPPADILRIAVVHPAGSAGWGDVRTEIERLERRGILTCVSLPAIFEGGEAKASLCTALEQAAAVAARDGLDLVLLVRGGGAAAGLRTLSNGDVARAICRLPVPVVTGLGHAQDRTLLDEIAWRATDTPSKAIGLVIRKLRDRAATAERDFRSIQDDFRRLLERQVRPSLEQARASLHRNVQAVVDRTSTATQEARQVAQSWRDTVNIRLDHLRADLERDYTQLIHGSRAVPLTQSTELSEGYGTLLTSFRARVQALDDTEPRVQTLRGAGHDLLRRQAEAVDRLRREIQQLMKRSVSEASLRLDALEREARALSVESTLKRGYAIALDPQRRIIKSVSEVQSRPFTLILSGGAVAAIGGDPL